MLEGCSKLFIRLSTLNSQLSTFLMFDPTKPANNTPASSAEMRAQLNGLKALIDDAALIGSLKPWLKNFPGVPALPAQWAECNGQVLNDPDSPLNGQTLPDINVAQRFLRGAATSGGTGGNDAHQHSITGQGYGGVTAGSDLYTGPPSATDTASSLPPYYEAVWVMRVK